MRILSSKLSRSFFLPLILTISSLTLLSLSLIRGRAAADSSHQHPQTVNGAVPISLRVSGERPAWLHLADGRELPADDHSPSSNSSILADANVSALSLASGDFDEDGTADLVSGYRVAGKGLLAIHRGNPDAISANTPEAKKRKADGTFTEAAFLTPTAQFALDSPPEMIFTGDFDADDHLDVLAASIGSTTLSLLRGDGHGNLLTAKKIELEGSLTATTVGEINRTDGLADVAAAILTSSGPQLLTFSGPEGAFKEKPRAERLPGRATAMSMGRLDKGCEGDLVIAAGRELLVIHRPYKQSPQESADGSQVEVIESRAFPYQIKQVAIGDFIRDEQHNAEIALMREDGGIDLLKATRGAAKEASRQALANWEQETATGEIASATRMVAAKVSSSSVDDLIVIAPESPQVQVVSRAAEIVAKADRLKPLRSAAEQMTTFEAEEAPVAVIAMRLNASALKGLVMLRERKTAPVIVPQSVGMTFTVVNTNDSGAGSLRQAILGANANPGADTIAFSIGTGQQTISLTSELPTITEAVVIDGTTQPGFAGAPIIELNGTSAGSLASGLTISGGSSTVRGLVINRFAQMGILMQTAGDNVITGNYIGTDVTGTANLGNGANGVRLDAPSNRVGGATAGERNIISGNGGSGIIIFQSDAIGNAVKGNYIGTDVTGTAKLSNSFDGVAIENASNNTVGGATAGERNIICGSRGSGVTIFSSGATGNVVAGNYIGIDATGAAKLGNSFNGVFITTTSSNRVGGVTAGERNIISGNGFDGVLISSATGNAVKGNYIGTDVTGTINLDNLRSGVRIDASNNTVGGTNAGEGNIIAFNGTGVVVLSGRGNAILQNAIFSNTGLGIDLGGDGVTANDSCDGDTGPNDLQNLPVLTSAFSSAATTTITGTLNSTTGHTFRIEFFVNSECDPSGFGEGQIPLGSTEVFDSGKDCNVGFTFTVGRGLPAGQFVTTTATDVTLGAANFNDTSEFSQCLAICVIACPANITQSNDPGQCGAIVTFQTATGTCGMATCNPPSGSLFPVGTTTVACSTTAGASCSFTVTVNDTQAPTIICPTNVTAVTNQATCPSPACQIANFPTPTASDNCPGVMVACTPPSGSCLPVGTSTVTGTATDASRNAVSCNLAVTVFDVCLQDDSNPSTVLLFNSLTGDYRFCCRGTTFTGGGAVTIKGCILTLQANPADRRVLATVDKSTFRGTASLQSPPGTTLCTIADRDIRNDSCACQ
jgi:hypothetical protein